MSLFENADNLRLLQKLLNPEQQERHSDSDSDCDDVPTTTSSNAFKTSKSSKVNKKSTGVTEPRKNVYAPAEVKEKQPNTIEEWQQQQEKEDAAILDTRKTPEYTLSYRQALHTEDIFLGMSGRTNATASCEDLVVEILLPEETTAEKMNLEINETELELSTQVYHLKIPFLHPVDANTSNAKFVADAQKLIVTLRMKRELDFVNF